MAEHHYTSTGRQDGNSAAGEQRDAAGVIFDMEDDLLKIKVLGHAMVAMFEYGANVSGLDTDTSAGGVCVGELMLAHTDKVISAWRDAFELTRAGQDGSA